MSDDQFTSLNPFYSNPIPVGPDTEVVKDPPYQDDDHDEVFKDTYPAYFGDEPLKANQRGLLRNLAKDIENLTSAGPGKISQKQLDALHTQAQHLVHLP